MSTARVGPNPSGICMCGCGGEAPIAKKTHRQFGHVKDTPQRFIRGHAASTAAKAANGNAYWIEEDGPLDSPCWIWQGALNSKGYASQGTRGQKSWQVHVRNLEILLGRPLHDGHQAHHRCEIKRCVNPDHLEELTPKQHAAMHPRRKVAA